MTHIEYLKNCPLQELQLMVQEIKNWKSTGILENGTFRKYADEYTKPLDANYKFQIVESALQDEVYNRFLEL
jgi:hypothetical protein